MTSAQKMISATPRPQDHQCEPDPRYDPIAITSWDHDAAGA
jgi:hypothetical protein